MNFRNFVGCQKNAIEKSMPRYIYSFATVLNIRCLSELRIERIKCSESKNSKSESIATFDSFVLSTELPEGTRVGDILVVKHDGLNVYGVIKKCKFKKACGKAIDDSASESTI